MRATVLIVDNDLGFVFWLGKTLDAAGYQSLPAKSIAAAGTLLEEITGKIDLLIVNSALPGAAEFITSLRRSLRRLKVIAVREVAGPFTTLPGVDVWRSKFQNIVDPSFGLEWLQLINRLANSV